MIPVQALTLFVLVMQGSAIFPAAVVTRLHHDTAPHNSQEGWLGVRTAQGDHPVLAQQSHHRSQHGSWTRGNVSLAKPTHMALLSCCTCHAPNIHPCCAAHWLSQLANAFK